MASLLFKTRTVAGRLSARTSFQQAALILDSRRPFSNEPGTVHPRPISPHVEIYAFPTTALTSIANRGTGVGLSIGKNCLRGMENQYLSIFSSHEGFLGAACAALTGNCDIPALWEGFDCFSIMSFSSYFSGFSA